MTINNGITLSKSGLILKIYYEIKPNCLMSIEIELWQIKLGWY